eukprot:TRINITY_DN6824_c0_g1_i2.p1 TRINITY_DN6824_c0_g1~~TRINITY_DN6824_c0_g1_i2.p1  ORF type:complete len:134 (-),score=12.54 TRINITY_DN6824_c0_g1_i2:36-437(-)
MTPTGKKALTSFTMQSYDLPSDTSIIACHPKTGRPHQIRVHLAHLGYPIANDEFYNPNCTPQSPPPNTQQHAGDHEATRPPEEVASCYDCSRNAYHDRPIHRLWFHASRYEITYRDGDTHAFECDITPPWLVI